MDLKQSARDLAIEYLLQEIKKGNLKAGDKLLNERKLSENLGISRFPVSYTHLDGYKRQVHVFINLSKKMLSCV